MTHFFLVHENGALSPLDQHLEVSNRIAMLRHLAPMRVDAKGRSFRDLEGYALSRLEQYGKLHLDSLREEAKELVKSGSARQDDFSALLGAGLNPQALIHQMKAVLEAKYQPLTSELVFPANNEIEPGAMEWQQVRTYETGEAVVYRGGSGSDIPTVSLGAATQTGKVVYLVSKAAVDFLEALVQRRLGLDHQSRKMAASQRAIRQLVNRWRWQGSAEFGIFGVYNNPYIDTALSAVSYLAATAADDIADDFGVWANYAQVESGSTFQANTLAISVKLAVFLRTRAYGDNRDKSLMEWLLSSNPHIKRVVEVPELNDIGGSTIHGMFFCSIGSGSSDSSIEMLPVMPPTLLPPDRRALMTEFYTVAGEAGINQTSAGDNLLVLVQGA